MYLGLISASSVLALLALGITFPLVGVSAGEEVSASTCCVPAPHGPGRRDPSCKRQAAEGLLEQVGGRIGQRVQGEDQTWEGSGNAARLQRLTQASLVLCPLNTTGADPGRPIGATRTQPWVMEPIFPYPEETSGSFPGPTGYSGGHFGVAVSLGCGEV